jgi:hypothetical protein
MIINIKTFKNKIKHIKETMFNNNSYKNDNIVKSIMIEINRKLYMTDNVIIQTQIDLLNKQINSI